MSPFQKKVVAAIQSVPRGKVVTYGQIAEHIGSPGAAIQVGTTMKSLELVVVMPWWRVVNASGKITIKGNIQNTAIKQRQLLRDEGIAVTEDFKLNLHVFRYKF